MKHAFLVIILGVFSVQSYAGSIGFGHVKGIKVGNNQNPDLKIYMEPGFTHDEHTCNGVIIVSRTQVNDERFEMIYSAAMASYMANKKVRFYSHSNNCNATFIALQESYF